MRAYAAGVLAALEAAFLWRWRRCRRAARDGDGLARAPRRASGTVAPGSATGSRRPRTRSPSRDAAPRQPGLHDAAAFAKAGVPMAMLFVRNANGSHNHDETMRSTTCSTRWRSSPAWLVAETCGRLRGAPSGGEAREAADGLAQHRVVAHDGGPAHDRGGRASR